MDHILWAEGAGYSILEAKSNDIRKVPNPVNKYILIMQNNCLGFAQNWDNVCTSDFGGLCCAPGMENRRYITITIIIIYY